MNEVDALRVELAATRRVLAESQRVARLGNWVLDHETGELSWSAEIFELFELDPDKFGASYEAFLHAIHPGDRDKVSAAYAESLETRQPYEITHRLLLPDDKIRWVNERCHTFFTAEGAPIRSHGTVQDVTAAVLAHQEQTRLQEHSAQTQRLESLGLLAGGIAHDFNNLLTTVLGNCSVIRSQRDLSGASQRSLADIEEGARRAALLCAQLLAYAGKGRFVSQVVDLSNLIRSMTALVRVSLPRATTLKLDLTDGLPGVEGDLAQLQQVVLNLVLNGAEALGGEEGTVHLRTGIVDADLHYVRANAFGSEISPGKYVFLEVTDDGCGMSQETQQSLFEPFFTTKATGRGLGMSAVQGIVANHHGAMRVYSEEGLGSTFKLLFPATSQAAEEVVAETPVTFKGKGLVLVVDDDDSVRRTALRCFSLLGFDTLDCESGEEALALYAARSTEIQLVFLDMTMPGIGGRECFRRLRVFDADVQVILTSGYNEQRTISTVVGKGLAGFVQKPYSLSDLEHALEQVEWD